MERNCLDFPFSIEDMPNTLSGRTLVKVGPQRFVYPSTYRVLGPQFYNFKIRASDVFLVGFPRSGTTWTQEAVWLMNNNLDYAKAKSTLISDRISHLDIGLLERNFEEWAERLPSNDKTVVLNKIFSPIEWLSKQTSPRFIKTHIPLSLLPPNLLDTAKVVYVARDPRDVAVSLYMLMKLKYLKEVDFKIFWKAFSEGTIIWSPHMEHVTEAWNLRSHPNLLFLTYEDMSKDLTSSLRRMAEFFGKDYTDEQIQGLCEHLSFDNFKKNEAVNQKATYKKIGIVDDGDHSFIRKGKVGGWRDNFDEDLKTKAANWMAEKLSGTDLPFTP